jgi:hypothetical protein
MVVLASLATLDESGVAVCQTGGWDPLRGIQIPGVPTRVPSLPVGLLVPVPPRPPAPWIGARDLQAAPLPQVAPGGRRKRGDAGCATPTGHFFGPPRSVRGLLVGLRRLAPRPRVRRGASVLHHHHHRVRRHRNHHHHRSRHRHHHLGVISPRGTTTSSNNSSCNSSGRPTSKVAGKFRAPSECNPFFPLVCLSCRRVLTHPLLVKASSSSAPKVVPPPPPAAIAETALPGSHAPAGGPAAAAPTSSGVAAEGVPTAPTATAASTTVMPSSTPSAAAEEVPTAPTPTIKGDAGGTPSSISSHTLEEAEVVFGRRL